MLENFELSRLATSLFYPNRFNWEELFFHDSQAAILIAFKKMFLAPGSKSAVAKRLFLEALP
jgi:hypothetical protein